MKIIFLGEGRINERDICKKNARSALVQNGSETKKSAKVFLADFLFLCGF
jgi:hypothetical protein